MTINEIFTLVQNKDFEILHSRVAENTLEIEQEIIALKVRGDNINIQNPETGLTILHLICGGILENDLLDYFEAHHIVNTTEPLLCVAAQRGNTPAISWLLDKGQDINIQNIYSETPLHLAVGYGHLEAINLLLTNGADMTLTDIDGVNALMKFFVAGNQSDTDDIQIKILELLIQHCSNVNQIGEHTLIEYAMNPGFQEVPFFNKALLLLLGTRNVNVPLDIQEIFNYFSLEDNINQLFAVEGYEQHKMIAAGYNLYKALREYGEINNNQNALNTAAHINQVVLNNDADILEIAINSIKPHVLIPNIEQSNNIYLLRDNIIKCEELKKLVIRLRESDIALEEILDQRSPFYEFSTCLNHFEEAEIATVKRITEVFIKNLILPQLPEEESLREKLEIAITPEEKALLIQKIQAFGMKEVFSKGDIMYLICSFLDPQSASDFSYTNKNPLETLISFPDQEALGNIDDLHIS